MLTRLKNPITIYHLLSNSLKETVFGKRTLPRENHISTVFQPKYQSVRNVLKRKTIMKDVSGLKYLPEVG
jgi:hypothetical protein